MFVFIFAMSIISSSYKNGITPTLPILKYIFQFSRRPWAAGLPIPFGNWHCHEPLQVICQQEQGQQNHIIAKKNVHIFKIARRCQPPCRHSDSPAEGKAFQVENGEIISISRKTLTFT